MSVCLSIWKRNCNLVPLPSLSWFCFFQTLFLVSEQVIKKSILLAYFRNSGKMNFYIRDWWSSIFIVREPCQGPARPPNFPPPPVRPSYEDPETFITAPYTHQLKINVSQYPFQPCVYLFSSFAFEERCQERSLYYPVSQPSLPVSSLIIISYNYARITWQTIIA